MSKYLNMNELFRALNDQTRREILNNLKKRSMSAGEIAELFNISKPSISHHLEILRKADLVRSEKKGQFVVYSINTTMMDELLQWILTFK